MRRTNLFSIGLLLLTVFFIPSCKEDDEPVFVQVIITNPADGSTLNSSVTIKAEVTPNDGVEKVSFLIDGEIIGEDLTAPYEHLWYNFIWTDGNLHSILAKAKYDNGSEELSNVISVRVSEASIILNAIPEDGKNIISWEQVEGALSYNIYWSEIVPLFFDGTARKLENVTSPYSHTGLTNGRIYYYGMTAVFIYGESHISTVFIIIPGTPPIPTNVKVLPEDSQNVISWDNATGAETYNIYWSESSGVTTTNGSKLENAITPYTHIGLTNGTVYYYIVTAVNVYGESNASNEVNAIPG